MSLRIPLAALVAAASLTFAPAALAVGTSSVSSPSDGATYGYRTAAAPAIAVSGTASGMTRVDLRCAHAFGGTWDYSSALAGGTDLTVSGGAFSAPGVTLPTNDGNALCRLVAVPTGTTPTDLTGLTGPTLRLLKLDDTGGGNVDTLGGSNNGKLYDFYATAGGTSADAYVDSAGGEGLSYTGLVNGEPSELGQVFGDSGFIPELDPTGPTSDGDGPLTGMLVDGVNVFNGAEWEDHAITGTTRIPFSSYANFPLVTVTQSSAPDGSFVVSEHDLISECTGSDPMYYRPGGFTCQNLVDSGVALDVVTTISPAGNVVDRLWRVGSTDGRAHQVALWMGNDAASNALPRAWKGPGETMYAQHSSGDTLPPPAAGAWAAEFHSVGAADGDTSEGVGALVVGSAPAALRFAGQYELDGKFSVAVPAGGATQLDTVYISDATQAALDADVAAAIARLSGRSPGGGGGGGGGGGVGTKPALSRTGKALLGLTGKLSLGYALTCPADAATSCSASVVLTQPVRRAKRRHAAKAHHAKKRRAARRARPRVLGRLAVTVASGRTLALTMTIARRYRAAFKAGHVTMTARLARTGVATQTVVKPLPVKIAKPKPRRRAHRRR
jgi:hypothetical protein